jgi:uncharacterized protein (TIGR00369 family)
LPTTPANRDEVRHALRARHDDFVPRVRSGPQRARRAKPAALAPVLKLDLDDFVALGEGRFPGLLGIQVDLVEEGRVQMHLPLREELLAPNGYLHAGTVVGLADSACGYGCIASLPESAVGFTTVELKTNFLGTALSGTLFSESRRVHGGRTTQVWDATVSEDSGKTIALFRCTQLLLYPE